MSTDPKFEWDRVAETDSFSNGLLKDACGHIRVICDVRFTSGYLSDIVMDSFVRRRLWVLGPTRRIIDRWDELPCASCVCYRLQVRIYKGW